MGKLLGVLALICLLAGLYVVGIVISAIAAIIGTVIGVFVVCGIVIAWLYFSYRQYRRNKRAL